VPGHEGRKADMSPAAGAAMRAVLKEMGRVGDDAADAAAGHTLAARHAAANKLITNHERVLRDLCRTDGAPVSQPELVRLPGAEAEVNVFLREAARRLLGRQPGQRARMPTREEGAGWAGAAKYLAGRLQVSEEEVGHVPGHEGRKADMSPAAGAAMQSVLAEMAKEGGDAAAGLGGARAMNSSHIEYEHADCTEQLTLLTASWITQALFSIGALLMLTMHKVLTHVEPKLFVGSFIVCAVGSCTYLAKNSGMDEIEISGRKVPIVRYVDWAITLPLMLYQLCDLGGADTASTLLVISCFLLFLFAALVAACTDRLKPVWCVVVCLFYGLTVYNLHSEVAEGTLSAQDQQARDLFHRLEIFCLVFWSCYPVVVLLGRLKPAVVSRLIEDALICALDCVAKLGMAGFILVWAIQTSD